MGRHIVSNPGGRNSIMGVAGITMPDSNTEDYHKVCFPGGIGCKFHGNCFSCPYRDCGSKCQSFRGRGDIIVSNREAYSLINAVVESYAIYPGYQLSY